MGQTGQDDDMTQTINTDTSLSFAAIGLWHKALALFGVHFDSEELLTVHPDPNAWGPFNESHDILGPLEELMALGYVQTSDGGATYMLHYALGEDLGCWECMGYVRPGTYCGACGLISEEGGDGGQGSRSNPD